MSSSPQGSTAPPAPRMTLTVAAVARRLGVAPATLRTWDRRYGLGPSEHTAGAHRRYSSTDLARLVVMRRLTLEGVAPAEAAAIAATTAVADGGFALASVSTIPAAVIEAAVTDAAALAGPEQDGQDPAAADPRPGLPDPAAGAGAASGGAIGGEDDDEDDDEGPGAPRGAAGRPAAPAHAPGGLQDWAVQSLADRFAEEVRNRGAAAAWDAVLGPALATDDAALHEAVARALAVLPTRDDERSVVLAGADPAPRGPLLLAAAVALAEAGAGARSVGDGVPVRVLAAAVRRARPPAVLLHAHRERGPADVAALAVLLAVRPAPLLVLSGPGWPKAVEGCERATSLADAVRRCAAAVHG
ncbi:MerR family transcriptional regulator [Kineococcus sp. TRM81007]|nr:MerR family transcriptional regulator [Kineococcus sp. TRM81007]MCI2238765.1 MerR family transcriptional regulator [Kineococcus sp. TRM81007]